MWVIQNINNAKEFWSNKNGWVDRGSATIFPSHSGSLPMGGEWISTEATLLKVKEIRIRRAEGFHHETKDTYRFSSFTAADVCLRRMARTAPEDGSYNKTDFWVVYANGYQYSGRFDLKREHQAGANLLSTHMGEFLGILAGRFVPLYVRTAASPRELKEAEGFHRMVKLYEQDGTKAGAVYFLETYKIGD